MLRTEVQYEAWLVADRNPLEFLPIGHHVFVASIKKETQFFNDGSKKVLPWAVLNTVGVWPGAGQWKNAKQNQTVPGGIVHNLPIEAQNVTDILNGKVNGQFSVRKKIVNKSQIDSLFSNTSVAGCKSDTYSLLGFGENCSCATFATRLWYKNFNEDFRPQFALDRYPLYVADRIEEINKNPAFYGGGGSW